MDTQKETFREEANELISELQTSLLELEESPDDIGLIGRVFRAMHTIKGSGSMFGFDEIANFTHNLETVFDRVRDGRVVVTRELVNISLSAVDHIQNLLDGVYVDKSEEEVLVESIRMLIPDVDNAPIEARVEEKEKPDVLKRITYRIRFKPNHEIFSSGTNPHYLINDLKELGKSVITVHTHKIPPINEINPEYCYLYWDIILTTDKGINAIKDVFIFVEDECEITIDVIDDEDFDFETFTPDKLGEILVQRGDVDKETLSKALQKQTRLGEILVGEKIVSRSAIQSALAEQKFVKENLTKRKEVSQASSLRVPAEKLDQLVDLVGELVTVQARLSQNASNSTDSELVSIAEEVETLTTGLRDNAMSIRMLQIGTTFSSFKRIVRDLSNELGKNIELTTSGGETELDKTVIERLKDPLVHIIRNSIDHGIEYPEERAESGKPEKGTIHISAEHSGANVIIKISDDGKGLNVEEIRRKAEERGIISLDSDLSKTEIYNLIFSPGFSTAKKVTDLSGRGVGMDVVKKSIESLRGSVSMDSSEGGGTVITMKLPLTLAIIDGLLVTIGDGYYILPLSSVVECVELDKNDTLQKKGIHILNVRGDAVPYILLRDEYNINGGRPKVEQVVITETGGKRVGLVVDNVIGGHQTVIKNIGSAFKKVSDISGATILGNGTVALIIDVNKVVDFQH